MTMNKGTLYIVATPIGNREDITIRALKTLMRVPVIACEDTRRTGVLLKYYREQYTMCHSEFISGSASPDTQKLDVDQHDRNSTHTKPKLISYYDQIEQRRAPQIIELLKAGSDVALVSDAGTPLINDPGFVLVRECHRQGITVSPIPGPSSVTAALSVAGVPTDRFAYLGYLPKKKSKRNKAINQIKEIKNETIIHSVVLLESPSRLKQTVKDLYEIIGDSKITMLSEMTKFHELIQTFYLSEFQKLSIKKGEVVLIL